MGVVMWHGLNQNYAFPVEAKLVVKWPYSGAMFGLLSLTD